MITIPSSDPMNEASSFENQVRSNATYKEASAICKKYGYSLTGSCYVDCYEPSGQEFVTFGIKHSDDPHKPIVSYVSERFGAGYYTIELPPRSAKLRIEDYDELLDNMNSASRMVHELMKLDLYSLHKRVIKE